MAVSSPSAVHPTKNMKMDPANPSKWNPHSPRHSDQQMDLSRAHIYGYSSVYFLFGAVGHG